MPNKMAGVGETEREAFATLIEFYDGESMRDALHSGKSIAERLRDWQARSAGDAPREWIPVEQKFPAPNAYVWFWVPSLGISGAWETGYFRDEEGDRYWECERSDGYNDSIKYDRFQVSHWMLAELPDPPVVDSGAITAEEEKA